MRISCPFCRTGFLRKTDKEELAKGVNFQCWRCNAIFTIQLIKVECGREKR